MKGVNNVGGFVGYSRGNISFSFFKGSVEGEENVGGFIGQNGFFNSNNNNPAFVNDSYSISDVIGVNNVGGFTGIQYKNSSITNVYSVAKIDGNTIVGGFIGLNAGTISNAFWNIDSTMISKHNRNGFSSGIDSLITEDVIGLNPINLFNGFDFQNNWKLTKDYPALYFETVEGLIPPPTINSISYLNESPSNVINHNPNFKFVYSHSNGIEQGYYQHKYLLINLGIVIYGILNNSKL